MGGQTQWTLDRQIDAGAAGAVIVGQKHSCLFQFRGIGIYWSSNVSVNIRKPQATCHIRVDSGVLKRGGNLLYNVHAFSRATISLGWVVRRVESQTPNLWLLPVQFHAPFGSPRLASLQPADSKTQTHHRRHPPLLSCIRIDWAYQNANSLAFSALSSVRAKFFSTLHPLALAPRSFNFGAQGREITRDPEKKSATFAD